MKTQKEYVVQMLMGIDVWYSFAHYGNKEHAFERFKQLSNEHKELKYRVIEREIVEIEVYTNEEQPESNI